MPGNLSEISNDNIISSGLLSGFFANYDTDGIRSADYSLWSILNLGSYKTIQSQVYEKKFIKTIHFYTQMLLESVGEEGKG